MDINIAFLYSILDETVYIEQLEGFEVLGKEDFMYLLWKALYSLKQSSCSWFHIIAEILADFNFKQSTSDPFIWIHEDTNGE